MAPDLGSSTKRIRRCIFGICAGGCNVVVNPGATTSKMEELIFSASLTCPVTGTTAESFRPSTIVAEANAYGS
jgi:hypothetical protein